MSLRVFLYESQEGTDPGDAATFHDYEFNWIATDILQAGVIGVAAGTALKVTQFSGGANMSVDVAAGKAVIEFTNSGGTGATYKAVLSNTAVITLPIATADPTNPRKDIVYAKIDGSINPDASSGNACSIAVATGTPAGSPTAPSVPAGSILLATIDIPASDTTIANAQITDGRTMVQLKTTVLPDVARVADLSSTANAKGASTIGVEDAAGNYTATNVETVLAEIKTALNATLTISSIGFFGNGSDGVPNWAAGATLDPTNEFQYTSASLPAGQTLTISPVNKPLIIKTTGNVTIDGTIDLNGKGGAGQPTGGTPRTGTTGAGNPGSAGTDGTSKITGVVAGAGGGGSGGTSVNDGSLHGGGGGGGASGINPGIIGAATAAATGGTPGVKTDANFLHLLQSLGRCVVCGGGGGSGGGGGRPSGGADGGAGGAGGAGAGSLVWYIGGNLTLGAASIIRANGVNGTQGTDATGGDGGGGGGGGGGMILIIVAGTITNGGVTLTATAGSGAAGIGSGKAGGNGGAGKALIFSLATGTLIQA